MHPALSVIAFTTLSGAGFGALAWLGLLLAAAPYSRAAWAVSLFIAAAVAAAGLVSSLGHLGQPQRAWRALSQWRSSWLSREGVFALATLALAGVLMLPLGLGEGMVRGLAVALAVAAVATQWSTAMIYRSLPTVPAWYDDRVVILYLSCAAASGLVLLAALHDEVLLSWGAMALGVLMLALQHDYSRWRATRASLPSRASALGVAADPTFAGARINVFERPHTEASYLTEEMVFRMARRHAESLTRIARVAVLSSAIALLAAAAVAPDALVRPLAIAALLAQLVGIGVDRWLFFAEARHVVEVYYRG